MFDEDEFPGVDPADLYIGPAYLKEFGENMSYVGSVIHVPLTPEAESALYQAVRAVGLGDDLICEDEFGNPYIWVIGG